MTLCRPCGDLQLSVAAMRIVGKTPMCDKHFRQAMGMPKLETVRGETRMPKQTSEGTRAAILRDAESGMNTEEIRKKHGVGWITAKKIIDGSGLITAAKAKRRRPAKAAAKPANGNGAAKSSNGSATLTVTPELCDAVWSALPLEKKAGLLNRLAEV